MATPGSSLIVQIQIAIVGIMIVLGAFFIWRMISSLDNRLTLLEHSIVGGGGGAKSTSSKTSIDPYTDLAQKILNSQGQRDKEKEEEDYEDEGIDGEEEGEEGEDIEYSEDNGFSAEQMMKVFGNISEEGIFGTSGATIVITSFQGEGQGEGEEKREGEGEDHETSNRLHIKDITDLDTPSEADTDAGNPLSRTKLKAMKVEKLKDICAERAYSTEGTKAQLIERILGLTRD